MLFAQYSGRKYRRDNQTGNKGETMSTGVFCEEGSTSAVMFRHPRSRMLPAPLEKVLSHVANTDKNNGLIYGIRVNKKCKLMGQSVYNLWRTLCDFLRDLPAIGT